MVPPSPRCRSLAHFCVNELTPLARFLHRKAVEDSPHHLRYLRYLRLKPGCPLRGRMNLDGLVSKATAPREVNDGCAALKDETLTRVVVTSS